MAQRNREDGIEETRITYLGRAKEKRVSPDAPLVLQQLQV